MSVLMRNWTIVRVLSMMESVVFMILISTQNDTEQIQDDDRHSVDTIKYRTNSKYINYNKLHLFQPPYFDYSGFTTTQSLGSNPSLASVVSVSITNFFALYCSSMSGMAEKAFLIHF